MYRGWIDWRDSNDEYIGDSLSRKSFVDRQLCKV